MKVLSHKDAERLLAYLTKARNLIEKARAESDDDEVGVSCNAMDAITVVAHHVRWLVDDMTWI